MGFGFSGFVYEYEYDYGKVNRRGNGKGGFFGSHMNFKHSFFFPFSLPFFSFSSSFRLVFPFRPFLVLESRGGDRKKKSGKERKHEESEEGDKTKEKLKGEERG